MKIYTMVCILRRGLRASREDKQRRIGSIEVEKVGGGKGESEAFDQARAIPMHTSERPTP